ncbi:MAG: RHS repeat-associated core domain-containing protein [Flavobacteriales bacterium]|nr:RHS repeat-associated core domain-containing protein [Flavobacteriales bacterium]
MTANQGENIQYKYNTQGLVTEVHYNNIKRVAFFYDERGQRVKKISYNATGTTVINTDYYIRDLSGNVMSIYNSSIGNNNTISQTELPIYGGSRLGVYTRNGTTQYQITDHLGNVRAVIEKNTQNPLGVDQTDYSDYYPFGEKLPMRNMFSKYRYAFQGQELDPETGMEAFQLRLWDGRIGRWLTTDPYGQYHSPYLGMGNDPVNGIDPDGGWWFKRKAERERQKAIDTGLEVSEVQGKLGSYSFTVFKEERVFDATTGEVLSGVEGTLYDSGKWVNEVPAQITQKPITWVNKWAESENALIKGSYDFIDGPAVAFQSINPFDQKLQHLDGSGVSPKEKLNAGVDAIASLSPAPKSSVSIIKKMNAAQFSKFFKGTFVARMSSKSRGWVNRKVNVITTKYTNEAFVFEKSIEASKTIHSEINKE